MKSCISVQRKRLNRVRDRRAMRQNSKLNRNLPIIRLTQTNRNLYVMISYGGSTITRASTLCVREIMPLRDKVVKLGKLVYDRLANKPSLDISSWTKFSYHLGYRVYNPTIKAFIDSFKVNFNNE